MALFDKIRGEFVDIVEWMDESNDTMVYRFERYGNEIKYGAKLIVRESQVGVFVNEGQIGDVFSPGTYTLETQNLPILSTLKGWKHGFHSPFKAEVYFVSVRQFTDLKWGTKNPIMLRDAEFGPVRLRAFGSYVMRVKDAPKFIREIVGTDGHFTTDEISSQLRNMILTRFSDLLGESKIAVLDLAANYDEFSQFASEKLASEFEAYGLEVTKFLVENISLPEAVEKALDKRSSMGVIGNLGAYSQFQAANAMEAAANNPGTAGGGMGMGMGVGMGVAMAGQVGQVMNSQTQPNQQAAPPPIPQAASFFVAVNGQQTGPYDTGALAQQAASGSLTSQSMVWQQGMAQWTQAGQVPQLARLFAPPPPPPPPM